MRELIKRIPILGDVAGHIYRRLFARRRKRAPFPGSAEYWERHYSLGRNSGPGSYGRLAEFKAGILNAFVATHEVRTVIEFGCGDGNQLSLAKYPAYSGFDVSATAVSLCRERFTADTGKSFRLLRDYSGETADLSLSLDVVFHLVEDHVFEHYMRTLFGASHRHVIIYSSDSDDNPYYDPHFRHRKFTRWVAAHLPSWRLAEHLPNRFPYRGDQMNESYADFFIYEKGAL